MKKYYIIFGTVSVLFVLAIATMVCNPDSHRLLTRNPTFNSPDITTSLAGDILLIIVGIIFIIAVISVIVYQIYKLVCRIRGKKDFTADAEELYTKH